MVSRLECSTQNYLCQINYTPLILSSHWNKNDNEQHRSARWVSAFPLKHSELNEYQLYYTLCMKRCQPRRAVRKYFYFNVKFQRKTLRNCYAHLPLQLLFLGCGSETRFQWVSCAPASSVFRERFSWSVSHWVTLDNKSLCSIKHAFVKKSKAHGPWSQKQVLSLLLFLLEPNTEAAEGGLFTKHHCNRMEPAKVTALSTLVVCEPSHLSALE